MIQLRDYSEADIERLVVLANNKNVSRYLIDTFPYPYQRDDAVQWIRQGSSANNAITKVIEFNGEFVGSIGLAPQTGWKSHAAEIGYWLGEDYWGRGIATAALQQMTQYALHALHYKKLFAPVLAPNNASMRVLQKCGYVLEGVHRDEVFKDGAYFDIHHYAVYQ